jgi:transcriptional regulator with XRE-family HTH domain
MLRSQGGEILAKNMKRLRKQVDWNQQDLADKSGYSLENIKRLETVATWVSADGLQRIARAFGCHEIELFRDDSVPRRIAPKEALEAIAKEMGFECELSKKKVLTPSKDALNTPGIDQVVKLLSTFDESQIADIISGIESFSAGFRTTERDLDSFKPAKKIK